MRYGDFDLNKNHRVFYGDEYGGVPLVNGNRPMVVEFLDVLYGVVDKALGQYSRVSGFRFDLHLPESMQAQAQAMDNSVMSRFVDSLKAKISHNRRMAAKGGGQVHDTEVRYFWVREVGDWGKVHYHFALPLNGYAFNWLGSYESKSGNLACRIKEAWASAIGMHAETAGTLVHFPENPTYELRRGDPASVEAFVQRASYMCKAATKQYGQGWHGYGASRN